MEATPRTEEHNDATPSPSRIARFHALSQQLLNYSNKGLLRKDFLPMVAEALIESSGSDSVELWVKEGTKKHFRCSITRAGRMPFGFILVPAPLGDEAAPPMADAGTVGMEELGCRVIRGIRERTLAASDGAGRSFTTGDTREPVLLASIGSPEAKPAEVHLVADCRSLSLIPIVVEEECVGLLQLKSNQRSCYSSDDVAFYEGISEVLGVAVTHQYAQIELRERVKELTCLYGIARVVARPGADYDEVMQSIVDLLPGAWLYPELAGARIVIEGRTYLTPGFAETPYRQRSDILVRGESVGWVEVSYCQKRLTMDEGPFLEEERSLIDSVAQEVSYYHARTRAEQERVVLQEQLRHADRLATIGQLAAGIAHELNEPLGNILGLAQLALKSNGLQPELQEDLTGIESASLHAREIIRKLMVFARQLPSQRAAVILNDVVRDGLYFFEARCLKSGIELVQTLAPELPSITADPGQLNQVLVNLVVNALQAMPEGGALTVVTAEDGDHVILQVEDTGVGMSESVREQAFLPFFTTKDIREGTGLGLAVVHGIVTQHGGTIEVESREGSGSRFRVRLPIEDPGGGR